MINCVNQSEYDSYLENDDELIEEDGDVDDDNDSYDDDDEEELSKYEDDINDVVDDIYDEQQPICCRGGFRISTINDYYNLFKLDHLKNFSDIYGINRNCFFQQQLGGVKNEQQQPIIYFKINLRKKNKTKCEKINSIYDEILSILGNMKADLSSHPARPNHHHCCCCCWESEHHCKKKSIWEEEEKDERKKIRHREAYKRKLPRRKRRKESSDEEEEIKFVKPKNKPIDWSKQYKRVQQKLKPDYYTEIELEKLVENLRPEGNSWDLNNKNYTLEELELANLLAEIKNPTRQVPFINQQQQREEMEQSRNAEEPPVKHYVEDKSGKRLYRSKQKPPTETYRGKNKDGVFPTSVKLFGHELFPVLE